MVSYHSSLSFSLSLSLSLSLYLVCYVYIVRCSVLFCSFFPILFYRFLTIWIDTVKRTVRTISINHFLQHLNSTVCLMFVGWLVYFLFTYRFKHTYSKTDYKWDLLLMLLLVLLVLLMPFIFCWLIAQFIFLLVLLLVCMDGKRCVPYHLHSRSYIIHHTTENKIQINKALDHFINELKKKYNIKKKKKKTWKHGTTEYKKT